MVARLELVSFHVAVFFTASISFIFLKIVNVLNTTPTLLGWLIYCGVVVVFISRVSCAYVIGHWVKSKPHGASLVIMLGHLAPIAGAYLSHLMAKAGTGSGLIFLPLIIWATLFYAVGIVWSLIRLSVCRSGSKL